MNLSSQEFFFSYRIINVIQKKKRSIHEYLCVYIYRLRFIKVFALNTGIFLSFYNYKFFPIIPRGPVFTTYRNREGEREREFLVGKKTITFSLLLCCVFSRYCRRSLDLASSPPSVFHCIPHGKCYVI